MALSDCCLTFEDKLISFIKRKKKVKKYGKKHDIIKSSEIIYQEDSGQ